MLKHFTSIKQGDYLEGIYNVKLKRIDIFANDTIIGYIGVPNIDKFGNYDMVNQGWNIIFMLKWSSCFST